MAPDSIPQKQCTKCKQSLPATIEYFQLNYASDKGTLRADCRQCRKAAKHAWDEAHKKPAKHPENTEHQRKCKQCQQVYPLADEYWHRTESHTHGYSYTCKTCACNRAKQWLQDNHEYALEYSRNYYQENKAAIAAAGKAWALANPDKAAAIKQGYIERDPERRRKQARDYHWNHHAESLERGKEYRRNHPEQSRKYHHIRKARILMAPGSFTADDIQRLYELTDGRCTYCGIPVHWDIPGDIHIDHVQPISRGGSNFPDNLAIACVDCNLSKAVKTLDEWQKVRGW